MTKEWEMNVRERENNCFFTPKRGNTLGLVSFCVKILIKISVLNVTHESESEL